MVPGDTYGERTRGWRVLVLAFVAGLLIFSGSGWADASTPAINQATSEAQALSNLIDQLDLQLEAATEDYNYANQQYKDTQTAVKKTSAALAQATQDLASAQDQFSERLVSIYKSGRLGSLDVVLGANSFSELVTRLDDLKWITEQDSLLVSEIQTYRTQEADAKAKLDSQLQQQETLKTQTAAAKQKVLDQLATQKQALKGKEAEVAALKKAEAKRQAELLAEEKARKAFLASRPGKVISLAEKYLGVPYVWGGSSPSGFDCSGLVQYVYSKVGISLPHSSRMQFDMGTAVSRSQLQPGDLVFFFTPIQHVGIYIGNGRMINATGSQVQISDVWPSTFRGGRRIL
jgi:cell wall-associated NlpC family hydrolase